MADEKGWQPMSKEEIQGFASVLGSPLPRVYVNGFMNNVTASDIVTIFQTNAQNVAIVNLSFSFAKTYALAILDLIKRLEQATGQPILVAGQIMEALGREEQPARTHPEQDSKPS